MGYCIYKICSNNIDYVYVGSTQNFTKRKYRHKSDCNNENNKSHNIKLYQTIRDNGGWENWRMVIIDEVGDITKRQAEMREEEWRQKIQANLNMKKCYTTEEEEKEYHKEYHIKYYDDNRDKILEQRKEYYEQNKEKIKEYNKEKITCECGCVVCKMHLSKHKKTKKHQTWEWRQTCLST